MTTAAELPDTFNKFCVGASVDGQIAILNAPLQARGLMPGTDAVDTMPAWPAVAPLTADEALNLAAWLVAVTGRRAAFLELLDAIERT